MKKKNWYQGLSLAEDQYIAEAHPHNVIKSPKNKILISLVAACACLALLIGNLWLFIPFHTDPPNVSRYADSEYYEVIQKLNALMFQPPRYKNNAEKLWAGLKDISFGDTKEGKWLEENCWKYGFIIRYPKSKESVTGYMYEPWHVRYLGKDVAKAVYNSGLCLEEYLGIDSVYAN